MYDGVPTAWVSPDASAARFASPRSASTIRWVPPPDSIPWDGRSRQFAGVMSRCTTPSAGRAVHRGAARVGRPADHLGHRRSRLDLLDALDALEASSPQL